MDYKPLITSAKVRRRFRLGACRGALIEDIIAAGPVTYLYTLVVFATGQEDPCLYVVSEVNTLAKRIGGGSHFLCGFSRNGHLNFGGSDDWAEFDKFTTRAFRIAKGQLAIEEEPLNLEDPDDVTEIERRSIIVRCLKKTRTQLAVGRDAPLNLEKSSESSTV